jgi:hypothetical protein
MGGPAGGAGLEGPACVRKPARILRTNSGVSRETGGQDPRIRARCASIRAI